MPHNLSHLTRINVIGTSGSGKTTFSRRLAEALNHPLIEMDRLYWGPNWRQPSDDELFRKVADALSGDSWILDGNYTRTIPIKWERVQLVVLLEYSFLRTIFRVTKRAIKRAITGEELWPNTGNRESFRKAFLSKDSIILWAIRSYGHAKDRFASYSADPNYRHVTFVRLASRREEDAFFNRAFANRPNS